MLQQMLVGRGVGQYISSGCGFLDFIKTYRDSAQEKKKSQSLFPATPFFSLSTHCSFSFSSFYFLNYKIYIAYNLSL